MRAPPDASRSYPSSRADDSSEPPRRLLESRIIGRLQVDRFDSFDERAILLGSVFHSLPLGVSLKILPTFCRGFLAGECQQIDKLSFCLLLIGWTPKPDDRHVVLLEDFAGVVAEASMQGVNLARGRVVSPQLENSRV